MRLLQMSPLGNLCAKTLPGGVHEERKKKYLLSLPKGKKQRPLKSREPDGEVTDHLHSFIPHSP